MADPTSTLIPATRCPHPTRPTARHGAGPLDVSGSMFLFTMVTFAIVAAALTKLVWRPMLNALDKREAYLRQSLDDAEKIEQELATLDEKKQEILDRGRQPGPGHPEPRPPGGRGGGAGDQGQGQGRGRHSPGHNAEREIRSAHDKARADLRQESVDTAIALAGKLIQENLDDQKNRQLTDRLIERL